MPGETYEVEIVAQGTTLEVLIDDDLIFSVTDTSFAEGTIALYSWGNSVTPVDLTRSTASHWHHRILSNTTLEDPRT